MNTTKTAGRPCRKARQPGLAKRSDKPSTRKSPTRLDQLQDMLLRSGGTTIADMCKATGWQSHSIRGAMSGALKKRGLVITSEKIGGERRYRATMPS